MNNNVRVRIAPSPTGKLHFGTARTALFNYLFAKKNEGSFILRIEDTDKTRSKKEYEENIINGLKWLGIEWDEGPDKPGAFPPYRQSERIDIHKKYLQELLDKKLAFWCHHSKEELDIEYAEKRSKKLPLVHECDQKTGSDESGIIRFRAPNKDISFDDLVRGPITVKGSALGDFSIAKNLEEPLYNFAAVIDDHLMEISHIIRGEDHISNTPKQIVLYESFGWTVPRFGHIPLILSSNRAKMSKRYGDVDLEFYRSKGYLPEAMVNFLAMLGWNPGTEQEIFSLKELENIFSVEKIQKSGAIFDQQKLDWINSYYIKQKSEKDLIDLVLPYIEKFKANREYIEKVLELAKLRMKKLSDINEFDFFFAMSDYLKEMLVWKNAENSEIHTHLSDMRGALNEIKEDDWNKDNIEKTVFDIANKLPDRGKLLWPLRVALSGEEKSPGPVEIAYVLGKEETLKRLESAMDKLM